MSKIEQDQIYTKFHVQRFPKSHRNAICIGFQDMRKNVIKGNIMPLRRGKRRGLLSYNKTADIFKTKRMISANFIYFLLLYRSGNLLQSISRLRCTLIN